MARGKARNRHFAARGRPSSLLIQSSPYLAEGGFLVISAQSRPSPVPSLSF